MVTYNKPKKKPGTKKTGIRRIPAGITYLGNGFNELNRYLML
jgi:hypothetical protein